MDPLEKLERFAAGFDLPFPLISDSERTLTSAYGVLKDNASRTAERSTVVIGRDRRVLLAYENVKARGHAAKVLEDFWAAAERGEL